MSRKVMSMDNHLTAECFALHSLTLVFHRDLLLWAGDSKTNGETSGKVLCIKENECPILATSCRVIHNSVIS